ncbi:hypothetical protein C8R45DRAFT_947588 [Mycena sanguinolenta]|nr:hypothetical protein C8R45DRAFT_947588 [Mycena sanguinolenta]
MASYCYDCAHKWLCACIRWKLCAPIKANWWLCAAIGYNKQETPESEAQCDISGRTGHNPGHVEQEEAKKEDAETKVQKTEQLKLEAHIALKAVEADAVAELHRAPKGHPHPHQNDQFTHDGLIELATTPRMGVSVPWDNIDPNGKPTSDTENGYKSTSAGANQELVKTVPNKQSGSMKRAQTSDEENVGKGQRQNRSQGRRQQTVEDDALRQRWAKDGEKVGHATCPECKRLLQYGPGGVVNHIKTHLGTKICDDDKKKYKVSINSRTMFQFFKKKLPTVPSTVQVPPPIHPSAPVPATPSQGTAETIGKAAATAVSTLPMPTANRRDGIAPEALWETLAPTFHKAFDYGGSAESRERMIETGPFGIGGFCRFLQYFVDRGLEGAIVELKAEQLLEALNFVFQKHRGTTSVSFTENQPEEPTVIDIDSDSENGGVSCSSKAPAPRLPPSETVVQCTGFVFPFGFEYPFDIHNKLSLPWSFSGKNAFQRAVDGGNPMARRAWVPESANYAYHSFSGLTELVRRKNRQIQALCLTKLNSTRKLLSRELCLSDHKRMVCVIASGQVQNVDRVCWVGLKNKRGIQALLSLHDEAARGFYKPKDYTEEDDLRGVLFWKMGGNRLADLAHHSLGLPSRTTLRSRLTVPPIVPSPRVPEASEVAQNVGAAFAGITDALAEKKVVHQILMFDELAMEKRIHWDDKTNNFLRVCRQHGRRVSLQFNSENDLTELFRALESTVPDDVVHYAGEATVGALGILSADSRLYAARPVLVSGDCKQESGEEHARNIIRPTIKGVNMKRELTKLHIVSLASDGKSRRGSAFIDLTFIQELSPESNIYVLLKDLPLMDLWVGEDDLTPDKDPKHVFKRIRNRLLRKTGTEAMGIHISPSIIRAHFQSVRHSASHIHALFNPKDKQNVKVAFDLLKDIWSLPLLFDETRPGFVSTWEALHTLGTLFYHLIFPYICVDFTLSEQLEHLSAAAHLTLILYHDGGKKALPTLLYTDIMLMIKNVYFCVAKAKVDDPDGNFWLILLGTDRLEQLFGILRTMIGSDRNLDILQLVERITETTECANIFAKYPHWDRPSRRLALPALTRNTTDTTVHDVTPLTSWRQGHRMLEEELPSLLPALQALDSDAASNPKINILSPMGSLITKVALDHDNNENDDDEASGDGESPTLAALSIDLEDAAIAEDERTASSDKPTIPHCITIGDKSLRKTRALALMQ